MEKRKEQSTKLPESLQSLPKNQQAKAVLHAAVSSKMMKQAVRKMENVKKDVPSSNEK